MKTVRIGAGAGFSGDRIEPAVEVAERGGVRYLVFECLAERTIALAQQARIKDPAQGYDPLLAERMRAGGCGIPGFYTKTGVGTVIADGKEVKTFDGQDYILERAIVADLAIVKAWKADDTGNLVFRKTARNFNPPAAMCGRVCVAEVEEIVPRGSLDPDMIHLPGIYVHRIVQGPHEKRIEQRTTRKKETA